MATSSGGTEAVFLLSGGYSVNQDNMSPAALDDSGRAVFAVHIADGRKATFNFNGSTPKLGMTNAIVDVNGVYRGRLSPGMMKAIKLLMMLSAGFMPGTSRGMSLFSMMTLKFQ